MADKKKKKKTILKKIGESAIYNQVVKPSMYLWTIQELIDMIPLETGGQIKKKRKRTKKKPTGWGKARYGK